LTRTDLSVPAEYSYFEDYIPGNVFEYREIRIDEGEILEFARRFDPQDMHVDPEKAARGRFGGLIASGWHTGAVMMRLLAEKFLPREASLASPGIDELRWLHPVRPGDVLRIRVTVLEATRSRSKPDRGMVRTLIEVLNQHSEVVMSLKPMNIMASRSIP
jgi:acyl dehydratase